MYLEMLKGQNIIINMDIEKDTLKHNLLDTMVFKMSEMAKSLGAKSVELMEEEMNIDDSIVINYYTDNFDHTTNFGDLYIYKDAKLVIEVFWCDLNKVLCLENIWYKNEKVGYYEYNSDCSNSWGNEVIEDEEYRFFDTISTNHDFTLNKLKKKDLFFTKEDNKLDTENYEVNYHCNWKIKDDENEVEYLKDTIKCKDDYIDKLTDELKELNTLYDKINAESKEELSIKLNNGDSSNALNEARYGTSNMTREVLYKKLMRCTRELELRKDINRKLNEQLKEEILFNENYEEEGEELTDLIDTLMVQIKNDEELKLEFSKINNNFKEIIAESRSQIESLNETIVVLSKEYTFE